MTRGDWSHRVKLLMFQSAIVLAACLALACWAWHLLEVSGEAEQRLGVRQDRATRVAQEARVPEPKEP